MESRKALRREINELHTLYRLNPHFRDIIVEGRDDAAWISWFLKSEGITNTQVYAVDDRVNVPRAVVLAVHPENNARGRVLATAYAFESWELSQPSLTAIIDADFDLLDRPPARPNSILATDYASMEVYGLQERPLSKFLAVIAKSSVTAADVVQLLKPAWATLYCVRYVLHRHHDGAALVQRFADRCVNKGGEVVVDARDLLRTATPSPARDALDQLMALHSEYLERVPAETLDGIRGHDVAPLLVRFLRLKNELADPKTVEHLLRASVDSSDLDSQAMFSKLRGRLSPAPI